MPTGFEVDVEASIDDSATIRHHLMFDSTNGDGDDCADHRDADEASPAANFCDALARAVAASE